ncbi:hypothetical protein ACIBJC_07365 [Streptomyces sp. NPDC050509]|uniref:hypothetical protein n=1 Tax=Streptomyces sp. NPDC050509 TaxID=3365620 RepID=UPI00378B1404
MPSSPSRQDPVQDSTAGAAPSARPQHHGIFLEPRYTVELPPHEGEGDEEAPVESFFDRPAATRRRTLTPRRN